MSQIQLRVMDDLDKIGWVDPPDILDLDIPIDDVDQQADSDNEPPY